MVLTVEGADALLEEDHALCGLGTVYGESARGPFHVFRKTNSSAFSLEEFLRFFSGKCMLPAESARLRDIRRRHDLPPGAQVNLCLTRRAELRVARLLRSNGYGPQSDVDISVRATGDGEVFRLVRVVERRQKKGAGSGAAEATGEVQ